MQRNPKHGTFVRPEGYEDLGGQLPFDHPVRVACKRAKHNRREFDNSLFMSRGTDIITICDECRYIYHTNMSD